MPLFNFVRWLKSLSRRRGVTLYRKPRRRLILESLEERIVPAPYTWSGAGADNKWTTGANWVGGIAPTGTAATLDDLTFGPNALQSTARNDFTNGVFGKITFAANNYTLIGNQLTLGDTAVAGSGYVVANNNVTGSTISFNVTMGGAGGSDQFFTINAGADLLMAGGISGATGSNIKKDGDGTLTLANNNSGFIGEINVAVGRLVVTHNQALGDTTNSTVVTSGATLQLSNVTGGSINEQLLVSGVGVANTGAVVNLAGTNTWSGNIDMDSNTTFTSTAGNLIVTGVIKDLGPSSGYDLTKEGPGQMTLNAANTFRGRMLIEDGILEIGNAQALGTADGAAGTGTEIRQSGGKTGGLQITSFAGITVVNERLQISSTGPANGSVYNLAGNNRWTGPVILGAANNNIGVNASTSLLIGQVTGQTGTGIVSGGATNGLQKTGTGNLIFTSANTYSGATAVAAGTLTIRDSRGLGSTIASTTVANIATVALEVDSIADSVTGNTTHLTIDENITITGLGFGGVGALQSLSGYNTCSGDISLTGTLSAIGVEPDTRIGHPTATNSYFNNDSTGDYKLTVTGNIGGVSTSALSKLGTGHLVLPSANTYQGATNIEEGWITIQNNLSLGTPVANTPPTLQPFTTVENGAALHLNPLTIGSNLNISNNFQLGGVGTEHDFGLIDEKGAIVSLGGRNTLTGTIYIAGQVGIGVQQAFITSGSAQDSAHPSELTITGTTREIPAATNLNFSNPSGNGLAFASVADVGTTAGTISAEFHVHGAPDAVRIYLGDVRGLGPGNYQGATTLPGADSSILLYDSGGIYTQPYSTAPYGYPPDPPNKHAVRIDITYNATTAQLTVTPIIDQRSGQLGTGWDVSGNPAYGVGGNLTFPTNTSTLISFVINQGSTSGSGTIWEVENASFVPSGNTSSGIVKLGQRRLNLQGDGTYTGNVVVAEGNLRAQHDSALGTAASGAMSTTTVQAGASLELASSLASNNGGIAGGIQVWNEHLILNGSGNTYFGTTPLVNMNGLDLANNPMAGDNMWRGPVTLNTFGTDFDVTFQNGLGLANQPPMTASGTNLTGTNAQVNVVTKVNGSGAQNEVQTVVFSGDITGGTFTLTFGLQTTGPIAYSENASELTRNIQLALDKLDTAGPGNTLVANTNAAIDIRKGTRLNIFGNIDDTGAPAVNGADLKVINSAGGSPYPGIAGTPGTGISQIALGGTNSFRGTTYVPNDMVLSILNGQALGAAGTSAVQTVTLGGSTSGTFALSFNGASTGQLAYSSSAAAIQTALNNLATIGGSTVGGSVAVTRVGDVITVTFGGNLKGFEQALLVATPLLGATAIVAQTQNGGGGTVIASGASIELQGNITVAGEPVILNGQGVASNPTIPYRWFQQGPAPITGSQTPNDSPNSFSSSGRITGVAIDPRDPNVIYVSTAGGGAWKTTNGGATWRPLFDAAGGNIPMFTGGIAVSSVNPNVIYLGTGEANNSFDSYYGTGVYRSTDAGITWSLVTGPVGPLFNPLNGRAVSKIVTDPLNVNTIYVAVSDMAVGGTSGSNAGIWRYNGTSWTNITAAVGSPSDNADILFDSTNAVWTDLVVMVDPVFPLGANRWIAAALGTPNGGAANGNGIYSNAVFISLNNGSTWTVNAFPTTETVNNVNYPIAGVIKIGMGRSGSDTGSTTNVYASVAFPTNNSNGNPSVAHTLRTIQVADITWDATNLVWVIDDWEAVGSIPANYLNVFGDFAHSVAANPTNANEVYVGGTGTALGTNVVLRSTDGGGSWTDISRDTTPRGPHAGVHAIAVTTNGILVGTDGGMYRYDATNSVWSDINSNLAISQVHGISVDPTNTNSAIAGIRSNGVAQFVGNFLWNYIDDRAAAAYFTSGGKVWIDPNNTQLMYAMETNGVNSTVLRRSTNGGTSWTTLATFGNSMTPPPVIMDQVNTNRLLTWNGILNNIAQITIGPGPNYTATTLSLGGPGGVTAIAAAAYQGDWVDDPSFSAAQGDVDAGSNSYVPHTIYTIAGNQVQLTKNAGAASPTWINRGTGASVNMPLPAGLTLSDIIVDPRNRDTVYVVSSHTRGALSDPFRVFMSTNAGVDWTDITGAGVTGLPDVAVWKVVLDPRSDILYVGTDIGVFSSVAGSGTWTRVGQGMPNVQVRDLVLNQSQNTLSAGTYGRSIYTFWLPATQANAGVLTSVSGSAVWQGAIILGSNTIISAKGTQQLQNGVSSATLNVLGTISDLTANGDFKLDKTGFGNVILSGANTYGGVTEIKAGVVVVRNAQALGQSSAETIVNSGTSLNLESSITGERLFLNGDGIQFNGHYTGALRNTANHNTYTGPIIAKSPDTGTGITIGVNIGTSLTISNSITDLNQALTVTKELTGTLLYSQGVTFNVTFEGPKGNMVQPTMTANNVSLTGTRPTVSASTVIPGSATAPLRNAVQTISFGGNITGGTFTLEYNGQTTNPITWQQDSDALRDAILAELEALTNIDLGDIVVATNMYRGGTMVNQGVLQVRNGMSLGSEPGAITQVIDGAAMQFMGTNEVQTITVTGINGTFNVEFNGQTATGIAYNAIASVLETALNNLSTIGGVGGSVTVTKSGTTYTITFGGTLAGTAVPKLDASRVGGTPSSTPTASEATVTHGSGPIVVPDSQILGLSGTGIFNSGALISTNGSHVWDGNVTLQREPAFAPSSNPSTIVAISASNAGDTLTIGGVIEDDPNDPAAYGLNKVGAGKAVLQGTNIYTGATTVSTGTLTIQNVQGLGTNAAGTTVNSGAMLQLDIAAGGTIAGEGLTLNGSGISNSGALQNLAGNNTWNGGVTLATSSTINVAGGSLNVTGNIGGAPGLTLTKRGANTLTVSNASNTFAGTTSVVAGRLHVNGTLGAISLVGGTLGGTGTVGAVTSASAGGTVDPGTSPGILNTGNISWNSATTYFVELNGTTPGSGHDQLNVTGTVSLGNATLAGTVGFSPALSNNFVIIQATGNISGSFGNTFSQSGNTFVFVGGYKFQVAIDNAGATKTVTLIHVASNTSTSVTTSKQSAVYGEGVTWTATVTNEQGGPASGTVDFIVDGTTTVAPGVSLTGGMATFQTSTLGSPLNVGNHTVTVNFTSGNGSFADSSGSLPGVGQTVTKANSSVTVTSSTGGTSVFGQDVTFTATVSPVAPGAGVPTGSVEFRINNHLVPGTYTLSGGTVILVTSSLAVSATAHTVRVDYLGDGNFNTSNNTLAGGQTVNKGNTSVAVSSSTGGTSVFGQAVTFTATVSAVSPSAGTPAGNVQFVIDGVTRSPVALNGSGQATTSTSSLATSGAVHTVTVNYLGSGNFNTSNGSLAGGQTVNKANTSVTVSSSTGGTSVFGQTVTFTATVAAVSPGAGTPTGNVEFIIDATTISPRALSGGIATFATGSLAIGPHTVTVNYLSPGDTNFNTSGNSLAGGHTVNQGSSSVAVSSSTGGTSVFGQAVTFTATVSAISPAIGTPTGNVEFVIDGATQAPVALSGGTATHTTSSLAVSGPVHTVTVNYLGSTQFATNSGSLAGGQTVNKANTTTTIGSSSGTTVFGQTVTFTATVSAVSPGAGTPSGNVNFLVDGVSVGFGALSGGVATFAINSIAVAGSPHTVASQYVGDGNFNTSSSGNGSHTVNKANTSVGMSSSTGTTVFGQTVTFTATVAAVSPGQGTPTGNVDFLVDGVSVGQGSLSGGIATFATGAISVAGSPHAITANYLGSGSFNTGSGTLAGGHTVNQANTSNTISTSNNNAAFGVPVIQATVNVTSPGAGTPTGNVDFVVTGDASFTQTVGLVGNTATFDITALTPGNYSITAQYQGDGNFNAAAVSSAISQTIIKANTTTTISSSTGGTSVFGQSVTFTATVSSGVGGLGTPTGNVEFIIDGGTVAASVALSGGTATFVTSSLSVTGSPHSVTANYLAPGDSNFNASTGTAISQTVNKASTSTSVTRTQPSTTAYGTTVTFTASVSAVSPGAGTVSGNVEFVIDGVTQAAQALSGGVATFTTDTLTPAGSPHSVSVNFIGSSSTDFNGSSGTLTGGQTISKINSAVTVSSSTGGTSVFGQAVTFTATVAAGASPNLGTPTGSVQFVIDGVTQAPVGLSGGIATSGPISNLAASGTAHTVTVNYLGNSNYNTGSGSLGGGQLVNKAGTSLTVGSNNLNSVFGEATITASISVTGPGAGTPTGNVRFVIDGVTQAPVALVGMTATMTQTLNASGTPYSIHAVYEGSSNFDSSTATAITQTVNQASSSTTVSSSTGGTSVFGQVVTFTATVSAVSPGAGTPTGNVEFVIDGVTVGTQALNGSGQATFSTIQSVGSHTVDANYQGSTNFAASSNSLGGGQTVSPANSLVTVTADLSPSVVDQMVTFTAHVTAVLPGGGLPTGTVNFRVNGVTVATGVALSGGMATFATSTLAIGTHTVQADFTSSDGNHANRSGGLSTGVHTVLGFSKIGVSINPPRISVNVPFALTLSALAANDAPVLSYTDNAPIRLMAAPAGGKIIGLKNARFVDGKLVLRGLRLTRPGVYRIRVITGGRVIDITIRSGGTWTYAQKQ
ncbi:MAG: hypothetical protein FJ271_17140 [Planctomycetes bacterium]|nr:hypothetical protein [Planctomycetota bacterium]